MAYLADTSIYVLAANDSTFRERAEAFIERHGPLVVSVVVLAEVLIGLPAERHPAAAKAVTAGGLVVAPVAEDWLEAARVVSRLGGDQVTKTRSFWNDALLAAQCARLGLTLVTGNQADFRRIGRHLGVEIVPAFPA